MVQVELEALFQEHCQLELVLHITFIVEAVVVPQQQV
jgi:transcriptional regulatory protein LevR